MSAPVRAGRRRATEVLDPRNSVRPELTRNVIGETGQCRERFFLGYNATPGTWSVTVRDVATGTTASAKVEVDAATAPGLLSE